MSKISPSFLDQILCCDCVEGMKKLPDGCIDLTVTSPPYGTMRNYGGQDFTYETFQAIARELFRLTKPGGVVVWIIREQILKGKGESGESPGNAYSSRRWASASITRW